MKENGKRLLVLGSILVVLFLAMTRQTYAVIVIFLLLVIKAVLLLKYTKSSAFRG